MFQEASYKMILRRLRWSGWNQPLSGPAWVSCFHPPRVSRQEKKPCWRSRSTWILHQSYLVGSLLKTIVLEREPFTSKIAQPNCSTFSERMWGMVSSCWLEELQIQHFSPRRPQMDDSWEVRERFDGVEDLLLLDLMSRGGPGHFL